MESFIVREISIDDIDAVMDIEKASFTGSTAWSKDDMIKEITKNELAKYVVVEVDGAIRGYGGLWRVADEGHITNVAVHPQWRRKHIGSSVLISMLDIGEQNGIKRFTLEVRESNVAAIKMYRRFGFKEEGIRKKYYDNKENAIIMWAYL